MLSEGVAPGSSAPLAANLKACERNHSLACSNAAGFYFQGWGTTVNKGRAKELWGKACKLGDDYSCDMLRDAEK